MSERPSRTAAAVEVRLRALVRAMGATAPGAATLTLETVVKQAARLGFRADVVMWRDDDGLIDTPLTVAEWEVLCEVAAALPHMPGPARAGIKALIRQQWSQP